MPIRKQPARAASPSPLSKRSSALLLPLGRFTVRKGICLRDAAFLRRRCLLRLLGELDGGRCYRLHFRLNAYIGRVVRPLRLRCRVGRRFQDGVGVGLRLFIFLVRSDRLAARDPSSRT